MEVAPRTESDVSVVMPTYNPTAAAGRTSLRDPPGGKKSPKAGTSAHSALNFHLSTKHSPQCFHNIQTQSAAFLARIRRTPPAPFEQMRDVIGSYYRPGV